MSEELTVELHSKGCACQGGSWITGAGRPACPVTDAPSAPVVLPLSHWRALGRPQNAEDYRRMLSRVSETGNRREFSRFRLLRRVRIARPSGWRGVGQSEETTTENIGVGGAFIRSRMLLERGEVLTFDYVEGPFRTQAQVRSVAIGWNGWCEARLAFLDVPFPESLIPPDAEDVDR